MYISISIAFCVCFNETLSPNISLRGLFVPDRLNLVGAFELRQNLISQLDSPDSHLYLDSQTKRNNVNFQKSKCAKHSKTESVDYSKGNNNDHHFSYIPRNSRCQGKKLMLGMKLRGGDRGKEGGLVSGVSQTEVSEGAAQFLPNSDTSQD